MKSFYHYAQNAKENRFQRYSDSYWTPFGKKQTDLIDLTLIDSTPFGFFFGANDTECPVATTEQTKETMGSVVQAFHMYEGLGHGDVISYNTPEFNQDIQSFLAPSEGDPSLELVIQ